MSHPEFNLDRHISIDNFVDPLGKKWEIHGERGSALVHARPNPDRADAIIPSMFAGQWTSPTVLREKLLTWLNREWDKSEIASTKAGRKDHAAKQTQEESLASLPVEIKEELGNILDTKKDTKPKATKTK